MVLLLICVVFATLGWVLWWFRLTLGVFCLVLCVFWFSLGVFWFILADLIVWRLFPVNFGGFWLILFCFRFLVSG